MAKIDDYESYDALDLAQLVRKGDVSATELLETAIKSVEERNPTLNAVVTPMYDEARQSIEAGLPDGPLRGVPFLLKDLGAFYNGVKTSYGSSLYADFIPDHDSELVIRYRKAGLVICGKTNTPEFGLPSQPNLACSVLAVIPGTWIVPPAAQAEGLPRPWPQAWCPRHMLLMVVDLFVSLHPAAVCLV
jgi:hypothetical protein